MARGQNDNDRDRSPAGDPAPIELTPIGLWFYHQAQHDGRVEMVRDERGRCRRCVELGWEAA